MTADDERMSRLDAFNEWRASDLDECEFQMNHEPAAGRTFSAAGMDELMAAMITFVGARLMARWDATNEPPTAVRVVLKVDVG
jgi:hypothetical protein